ncbi:MAG: caspase family protein [Lewinellaceae bacterium]|nr:caspase family protein [Lewinellaceae bacterium]
MPKIQDLIILPQGGHGNYPVIAAAILPATTEHPPILASLDVNARLVLWDITSGIQRADISLLRWDAYMGPEQQVGISRFKSHQLPPVQIHPIRLEAFNRQLFAYGHNAVFQFDLSQLPRGNSFFPKQVSFFGKPEETAIDFRDFGWKLQEEEAEKTGQFIFDYDCRNGTLSAQKEYYLCTNLGGPSPCLFLFNISDGTYRYFLESGLNCPIRQLKAFAFNELTNQLAILYQEDSSKGKAAFFNIKGETIKKLEGPIDIEAPYCLSPQADFVLWAHNKSMAPKWDWHICQSGPGIDTVLQKVRIEGPLLQMDFQSLDPTPGAPSGYVMLVGIEQAGIYQHDTGAEVFRFFQPGSAPVAASKPGKGKEKKFKSLSISADGLFLATVPGHLKENTIVPASSFVYFGDLKQKILRQKFNQPRPKIKKLELSEETEFQQKGSEPVSSEYLNIFFDNGSISRLQMGEQFNLEYKYSLRKYCTKAFPAATSPSNDVVAVWKEMPEVPDESRSNEIKLINGIAVTAHRIDANNFTVDNAAFSPDGRYLAVSEQGPRIQILDFENGLKKEKELVLPDFKWKDTVPKTCVRQMVFHPSEKKLAVLVELLPALAFPVVLYDWLAVKGPADAKVINNVSLQNRPFNIAFSEGGGFFILRGEEKSRIWKVPSFEEWLANPVELEKINECKATGKEGKALKLESLTGSLIDQHFGTSVSSPQIIREDSLILLESKGEKERRIEIWNLETFQEQLTTNTLAGEGPAFVVDTLHIPYSSFLVMKNKPILIFFHVNGDWIKWYDWEKKQLIATIIPYGKKEFILFNQDNRYFCGREGYGLAALQLDEEIFPMEQFDLMINRPDKVLQSVGLSSLPIQEEYLLAVEKRMQKILEERMKDTLFDLLPELPDGTLDPMMIEFFKIYKENVLNDEFYLPKIEVSDDPIVKKENELPWFKATVKTSKPEEKLVRLNVFVNDVPLYGKGGVPLLWSKLAHYMEKAELSLDRCGNHLKVSLQEKDGIITYDFTIYLDLSNGKNKIQIAVLNTDGIEAFKTIYVNHSTTRKPNLYLIGIALSDHENYRDLEKPEEDLIKLASTLLKRKKENDPDFEKLIIRTMPALDIMAGLKDEPELLAFANNSPEIELPKLPEKGQDRVKPTLENIRAFLAQQKEFLNKGQVDDRLLFLYSGHGLRGNQLQLMLSTYDMDTSKLHETALPYEELETFLDAIPPRNKLFIVDACNSGELDTQGQREGEDNESRRQAQKIFNLMRNTFIDLRRGTGATIISASQSLQEAFDTILVGHFLTALEKGTTKISELADFLIREVPESKLTEILGQDLKGEEHEDLRNQMQYAILSLMEKDLPRKFFRKELEELINNKFAQSLPEAFKPLHIKLKHKLINPIMDEVQKPSLRAKNIYNDWRIW